MAGTNNDIETLTGRKPASADEFARAQLDVLNPKSIQALGCVGSGMGEPGTAVKEDDNDS
jgi:hypothetical protein